ncbi:hypothetical protein DBZ36_08240 [Alginatibacterium sediminis]|uniref:SsuA/THI5-like domain-containing protein n=1 Tax=Alginatibacterium sediminis TaxID=2164068 RepID=A0A420EID8_9ALTE|nr:hypothetical protein DBZ36_08240 [Alginatibacterium sediminis]
MLSILLLGACQEQTQLRVAVSPWLGFEPVHLAHRLDANQQSPYQLIELTTPSHVVHSLETNQVGAAFLSLDQAIRVVDRGLDLQLLAITDQSYGADALVSQSHINTSAELQEQTIGYESNSLGALLAADWLEYDGFSAEQFVFVEAKLDEQLRLFRDGDVSALLSAGPVKSRLIDNLNGNLLFDSSESPRIYYRALVVRKDLSESEKLQVKRLVSDHFAGQQWMFQNLVEASKLIARRTQLYSREVDSEIARIQYYNQEQSESLINSIDFENYIQNLSQRMHSLGLINNNFAAEDFSFFELEALDSIKVKAEDGGV